VAQTHSRAPAHWRGREHCRDSGTSGSGLWRRSCDGGGGRKRSRARRP
jgi:hypothetical protein